MRVLLVSNDLMVSHVVSWCKKNNPHKYCFYQHEPSVLFFSSPFWNKYDFHPAKQKHPCWWLLGADVAALSFRPFSVAICPLQNGSLVSLTKLKLCFDNMLIWMNMFSMHWIPMHWKKKQQRGKCIQVHTNGDQDIIKTRVLLSRPGRDWILLHSYLSS